MKKRDATKRVPALIGLALAFVLGFVATIAVGTTAPTPTLEFYCMEFELRDDGSVQAWVKITMKNLEYCRGAAFNLQYDTKYLTPSHADTNVPYSSTGTDNKTDDFFKYAEVFYNGDDPFDREKMYGAAYDDTNDRPVLVLQLALDQDDIHGIDWTSNHTDTTKWEHTLHALPGAGDIVDRYYRLDDKIIIEELDRVFFDSDEDGVVLGKMSFYIEPDKVTEMVEAYSDSKESLIHVPSTTSNTEIAPWEMLFYELKGGRGNYELELADYAYGDNVGEVKYIFEFPNVLIRADLVEDFVRMNAWEAYAKGDWSDVAAALQREAGQIELGYANGALERETFAWGLEDDPAAPADLQPEYTVYCLADDVEKLWSDGTEESLRALDASNWVAVDTTTTEYNPKEGVYKVEQYYLYTEDGVEKRYPIPRTAYLVIDPVALTGAWAKDLDVTYEKDQAPTDPADLGLPTEAILQTSPSLGRVSLTVPVADWKPVDGTAMNDYWDSNTPDTYTFDPVFTTGSLNAAAAAAYPWLTIPEEIVDLKGTRTVLGTTLSYTYTATITRDPIELADADPGLRLDIHKRNNSDTQIDMVQGDIRVYMPNGEEIDPDWFDTTQYYYLERLANGSYFVEMDTDRPAAGYDAELDRLDRYVNLGGWFAVQVDEDADGSGVDLPLSDKIYVYLPPRENLHTASYIGDTRFNFTGHYAGLLPMYADSVDETAGTATVSPLGSTVVLPMDYFVTTTYDGYTGAEPGELDTVKVGDTHTDPWDNVTTTVSAVSTLWDGSTPVTVNRGESAVFAHGWVDKEDPEPDVAGDPFRHNAPYDAYGRVSNANGELVRIDTELAYPQPSSTDPTPETPSPKPQENLEVYYNGVVATTVVYETRQKGYVAREEIMLTLKNTGTTDASGIYLNLDYDPYGDATTGHFELTRAPAQYLPAGGETTFILTYVYNLEPEGDNKGTTYRDQISVGTNYTEVATTFFAQFRVTQGTLYRVRVVTIPTYNAALEDLAYNEMGSGEIIVGEVTDPATSAPVMDTSPGATSYEADYAFVWIKATTFSEYEVKDVYYYDAQNVLTPLEPRGTGGPDEYYYRFTMPDPGHAVTVYVEFYEPVESKLRMSSLLVYSGDVNDVQIDASGSNMIDDANREDLLRTMYWDDRNTNAPLTYPSDLTAVPPVTGKLYLTETESGYQEFFSVLPADTTGDYAQLSLELRTTLQMLHLDNATVMNDPLDPVQIEVTIPSRSLTVYSGTGHTYGNTSGYTADIHKTNTFESPDPGDTLMVEITLSYADEDGIETSRTFYLRLIRRRLEGPIPTLGYGNSPYGMIMNAANIADKGAAKTAFAAGDFFDPTSVDHATHIPSVVTDNGMYHTYWREGLAPLDGAVVSAWPMGDDGLPVNYDRDEEALFLLLGEGFQDPGVAQVTDRDGNQVYAVLDSAGNTVPLSDVTMSMEVELLDAGATTQTARFGGLLTTSVTPATAVIDFDGATLDVATAATGIAAGWEKDASGALAVRPGFYTMTYRFTDFDGTTVEFTRPVIVLAQLGDVNADGAVVNNDTADDIGGVADEALFENRAEDPLGYTIQDWAAAELFRLRSCDVNNDELMNNIDSNGIREYEDENVPFYLPIGYK